MIQKKLNESQPESAWWQCRWRRRPDKNGCCDISFFHQRPQKLSMFKTFWHCFTQLQFIYFFRTQKWFLAFVFANVRMAIFFMCSMPDIPVKEFYSEFFESVHLYLSEWQLIPAWQDPLSLISTSKFLVPCEGSQWHSRFPLLDLQEVFDCSDWFQPQIDRRCDKWLNTWSFSSNFAINAWYWDLVISSTTLYTC